MNKLKVVPRFIKEIILTVISYAVLWALWNFILKEYIVLSSQALSTIGLALSTSVGVLTAIVVSFVLITWQSSRQERSAAFWRWRDASRQLIEYFDANLEILWEIREEIKDLTLESVAVSLIHPTPRNKFNKLIKGVEKKITNVDEELQGTKEDSNEESEISQGELAKIHAYANISNYLTLLTAANFEHRLAHYLYPRVLSLRGLLYRLLVVLIASILVVAIGATTTSIGISDVFNAPLAAALIAWVIYVLIYLGREIKRITHLEDQFHRQEQK